jgi:hypothetical protein
VGAGVVACAVEESATGRWRANGTRLGLHWMRYCRAIHFLGKSVGRVGFSSVSCRRYGGDVKGCIFG